MYKEKYTGKIYQKNILDHVLHVPSVALDFINFKIFFLVAIYFFMINDPVDSVRSCKFV